MIARLVLALALCLATGRSDAWLIQKPAGAYVGPGDIAPYTAWGGTFAYSAAVAVPGTNPALRVTRRSDSAEIDIAIRTNGTLDVATAAAFTSIDTTGTGSISGTALTFTGGTLNDVVTGTGVLPGTFIMQGTSPNWTVNKSQTVASTTLTLTLPLFVVKVYDQVAGSACAGSCDWPTPGSVNRQPVLLLTGCGEAEDRPCIHGRLDSLSNVIGLTVGNFTPNAAAKVSLSGLVSRTIGGSGPALIDDNSLNRISQSAGNWTIIPGGCEVAAVTGTWVAINGVINGASSVLNVDGTEATCSGTATTSAGLSGYQLSFFSGTTYGAMAFGFADNSAWDASTRTALCNNYKLRGGSSGSC
jgi:hypothetical protein